MAENRTIESTVSTDSIQIKDINLDFFPEDDFSDEKKNWEEHYKRIGFYEAIISDSQNILDTLLEKQKEEVDRNIKEHNEKEQKYVDEITKRVLSREEKIKEKQLEIGFLKQKLVELKQEKINLISKIEASETEVKRIYTEIGKAKENIIEKRIETLGNEIDSLLLKQRDVVEKKQGELDSIYNKNKSKFDEQVQFYKKLLQKHQEKLDKLLRKFEDIKSLGINKEVSNQMIFFGYLLAIASGWFFTITAIDFNLSATTKQFFFIKGTLLFGSNLINHYNFYEIVFILFIVIVGIISTIYSITKRKFENHLAKFTQSTETIPDKINILYLDSLLTIKQRWLKLLIKFVIWGGSYTLITYGYLATSINEELTNLDISLSAFVIGFFISIGGAGIVYLYANYIIEPRLEKNTHTAGKHFIELFVILLLLFSVITTLIIYSFYPDLFSFESKKGLTAFILFIFCGPIASIVLAYGIRYKGIINSLEEQEQKLITLQEIIKRFSGPLTANWKESSLLKVREIVQNMLNIIKTKSQMIARQEGWAFKFSEMGKGTKRIWERLVINIKEVFRATDKTNNFQDENSLLDLPELEYADIHLLPELSHSYKINIEELKSLKINFESIKKLERQIQENEYEPIVRLVNEIERISVEIEEYRNRIYNYHNKKLNRINTLINVHNIRAQYFIKEGVLIGFWQKENNKSR